MSHTPKNYDAMRAEHARAFESLNQHIEQTQPSPSNVEAVEASRAASNEVAGGAEKGPPQQDAHNARVLGLGQTGGMESQHELVHQMMKDHHAQESQAPTQDQQAEKPGRDGVQGDRHQEALAALN